MRTMTLLFALTSGCSSPSSTPQPTEITSVEAAAEPTSGSEATVESTPCEQAYDGILVLLKELERQGLGGSTVERAVYLEGCSTLPPDAQQCMRLHYERQHLDECRAIRQRPDVQRFQEMLGEQARLESME